MGDNTAYRKNAVLIGSSAIACIGFGGLESSWHVYVPTAMYLTAEAFFDQFQLQTSLKSEMFESLPRDEPIPVPVVKLMNFKFGRPEEMKFIV